MDDLVIAEENVVKHKRVNKNMQISIVEMWNMKWDRKFGFLQLILRLKMKITPKLTQRWIGPFTIKRKLSPLNYELDLPSSFSIHPVFHISKLRLHRRK